MRAISLGFTSGHCLVVDEEGKKKVYGFGHSEKGQVGYGGTINQYLPIDITHQFPDEVVQISAGAYHTLALLADGRLFGWGKGSRGQLGYKYIKEVNTNHLKNPAEIKISEEPVKIASIASGSLYTLAQIY